jgi:prepilin-type N-terminal cleavage/methylation domain-containing protein
VRYSLAMRDRESGFTLLELMVTLLVIGILAAVALPSFFGELRKARSSSEVQPLFNDLRVRLEQFMQENGQYPTTIGEATMHPGSAPGTAAVAINPLPATWQAIKVRGSGTDTVYCRYTWATGAANDATNIGARAAAAVAPANAAPQGGFGFVAPATEWYYLLAQCNMNGTGRPSWYFTSSSDARIQNVDEGE